MKCLHCGKDLIIKEGTPNSQAKLRKYCNSSCAAFANTKNRLAKLDMNKLRKMGRRYGLKRGLAEHEEAVKAYYESPKHCAFCKKVIDIPDGYPPSWVKSRTYCSYECSARSRSKNRLFEKASDSDIAKALRGSRRLDIEGRTKGEILKESGNSYIMRIKIGMHARQVFARSGKQKICAICGYDKHTDVCHKKGIAKFSPDSLISEINDPKNLVALCLNHHWELDHGRLSPEDLAKVLSA